jgi:hypothetical protein
MLFRTGVLVFRGSGVVNPNYDITMNTIASPVVSRRQKTAGQNHHLWNNHGTWWFHGTFHLSGGTAERVRVNLKTNDLSSARSRRDFILSSRSLQNSQPAPDASS